MQTTQPPPAAQSPLLTKTWYAHYVLGALTLGYVLNTMDRSQILAASLQAIKKEFAASDFQMGVLTGIPFAFFYSFMGIPIAAWADRSSRRNVLALAVASWSAMTGIFGMAVNYAMLFAARVGTAVGEAGGSPPSHSLISDYFPKSRRGTAFSIFALGVPIGTSLGAALGGWGNQTIGWRMTFILAGVPGIVHCPDHVADGEGAATGTCPTASRAPPASERPCRACSRCCARCGRSGRFVT